VLRRLIEEHQADQLALPALLAMLAAHPEIMALNAGVEQKKPCVAPLSGSAQSCPRHHTSEQLGVQLNSTDRVHRNAHCNELGYCVLRSTS